MTAVATRDKLMHELIRGTRLKVGPSYSRGALKPGTEVVVASRATIRCNKGGRCAGPHCTGLAVFVALPDDAEKEGGKDHGWLRNTQKVCLTHLLDATGQPLIPLAEQEPSTAPEETPMALNRLNGTLPKSITWEHLAEVAQEGDKEKIIKVARALKAEVESLQREVIFCQREVINLQREKLQV